MKRDIVDVVCADGKTEKMEICLFVHLDCSHKGCVIYKTLNDRPAYYAAHYMNNNIAHTALDYDFTEEEKIELSGIFKELVRI